jgi:hypothetical protein
MPDLLSGAARREQPGNGASLPSPGTAALERFRERAGEALRSHLEGMSDEQVGSGPLKALRHRPVRGSALTAVFYNYGFFTLLGWAPTA